MKLDSHTFKSAEVFHVKPLACILRHVLIRAGSPNVAVIAVKHRTTFDVMTTDHDVSTGYAPAKSPLQECRGRSVGPLGLQFDAAEKSSYCHVSFEPRRHLDRSVKFVGWNAHIITAAKKE